MKNSLPISALAVIFFVISTISSVALAEEERSMEENMGYFFGYSFGNMLKQGGNENVDIETLMQGLRDSLAGETPDLTDAQQQAIVSAIQERQQQLQAQANQAQEQMAEQNLTAGEAFLAENAKEEGVKTTDSGLQYKILEEGEGESPEATSQVEVHYEGKLIDGTVFDSSYERGQPAEFGLNQVIAGWTEGLQLMKEGGKARLFIPPELGYGAGGTRGIPPNSVLVFDVELLDVK